MLLKEKMKKGTLKRKINKILGKKLYEREQRSNFIYDRIANLKESQIDELLTIIENYVFQW